MSEERNFGVEMSANRQRNHEFSSEARAAILTKLGEGIPVKEVARQFNTTPSTIRQTRKRWTEDHITHSRPRSGRPEVTSERDKRYIIRAVYQDREISWNSLVGELDGRVSKSTIQKIVRREFKRKWKSMNRPKLRPEHARKRRAWARVWAPKAEELVEV